VQLLRFYLRRPYWGSGMGDKLMQHCLVELSQLNYTDVWLSTWEKNGRARRFYRKWGFRPIGTAPFIVGTDRQTDLIMSRPVGPTGI
jgi:ribosomal protein S18 acetylase RimI-like enzyme